MDRKTSDAYEAPLSVKVTGTRRSEFQARHAAIVSHRLFIYKSRSDATPEQRLDLAHADLALVGDDSSNCTFVLRTQDNKQHFFRCDTARATTEWQVALSRAIKAASMAAK